LSSQKLDILHEPNSGEKRQNLPRIAPEERTNSFEEVEQSWEKEIAVIEAKRCLACRKCIGCGLCLAVCEKNAIVFQETEEEEEIHFDAVTLTPEVKKQGLPINEKYGKGKFINLISADAFERMIKDFGCYDGYVLRPWDGDIPGKIAFIIDLEDENQSLLPECCAYAYRISSAAKEKFESMEVWIFAAVRDSDRNRTENSAFQELSGHYKAVEVVSVTEVETSKDLKVTYVEYNEEKEEVFELAVLLNGFTFSETTRKILKMFDVNVGVNGYMESDEDTLVTTNNPHVYLAGYRFAKDAEKEGPMIREKLSY